MNVSFDDFFEAVWGYPPYPWQSRLANMVQADGWPAVLDLPTGSGKTAVVDIALYHLAVDGGNSAPRRILVIVDRRVIVDQVGCRARQLFGALQSPDEHRSPKRRAVLEEVREALQNMVGDGAPFLHTDLLRGGIPRGDAWAMYPHVPVIAGSTVDQVGSRLFFRGYGVSDRMKPLHAGLLGCDTLLFLDEVHLARPFADVLTQLQTLRLRGEGLISRRFDVVQLSATPGASMLHGVGEAYHGAGRGGEDLNRTRINQRVFRLRDQDRQNNRLARILQAPKPAFLEVVPVKSRAGEEKKRSMVAERAAQHARQMLVEGRRAVAVVVNRVDTARRAWQFLQDDAYDTVLLTGRMRPLDQAATTEIFAQRIMAGRAVDPEARPIVVVATQCVEAGADYDFDGLVTECASLDALRQRFGRLDRRGTFADRTQPSTGASADKAVATIGRTARGVILARSDVIGGVDDPVYGSALTSTWKWMTDVATDAVVDFGIDAIQPHLDAADPRMDEMLAPHRSTPVLLPAYLDQWAQTNPRPHADADVSLFLHGIPPDARSALPDVRVVWRSDFTEKDLGGDAAAREALFDCIAMVPPGALESISLPIWAVRQWLSQVETHKGSDIADLEGAFVEPDEIDGASRRVVIWGGRRNASIGYGHDVRPGATIIVPESYGGIGQHGTFDPSADFYSGAPMGITPDLGDIVQLRQRGRPTLRLDARVLHRMVTQDFARLLSGVRDEELDVGQELHQVVGAVRRSLADGVPSWFIEILEAVGDHPRYLTTPLGGWIAIGRRRPTPYIAASTVSTRAFERAALLDMTGGGAEDDESFVGGAAPSPLVEHLQGVGELAERFATRARLPASIVASIRWAGHFHDLGKVDPRFQLWLHGDEISARYGATLAKSAMAWQEVSARRHARQKAAYPEGQRHELVSLDMMERSAELQARVADDGADWDLVLHLVGSHHGWCRPLAPLVDAEGYGEPVTLQHSGIDLEGTTAHGRGRLDSGVTDRFWSLNRRYGWHELAYCEAILRLADHRQSAWEAEQ